jgi:hypothetical protein
VHKFYPTLHSKIFKLFENLRSPDLRRSDEQNGPFNTEVLLRYPLLNPLSRGGVKPERANDSASPVATLALEMGIREEKPQDLKE